MSYCSNCGGRLNDNGICPNCGSMSESKIQPDSQKISEVLNCFKSFFSSRPLTSVENAARTKSVSVWITFGVLFVISSVGTSLRFFQSIDANTSEALFGEKISNAVSLINSEISGEMMSAFVSLLLHSTLMSIFSLIIAAAFTLLVFILAEERPSFSQALNIITVAVFPSAICMIIAMAVSFLSLTLSASIIITGWAVSAISYYFGIQKASSFKKSPFIMFFASILSIDVLMCLISMILTKLIF